MKKNKIAKNIANESDFEQLYLEELRITEEMLADELKRNFDAEFFGGSGLAKAAKKQK